MRRWKARGVVSERKDQGTTMATIDRALLAQHWVHSHEEDNDQDMVFRPSTFKFGPSRGRQSFDLKADGTLMEGGIGPTDKREVSAGTWQVDSGGGLKLTHSQGGPPERAMQIASVDANRLVIKK